MPVGLKWSNMNEKLFLLSGSKFTESSSTLHEKTLHSAGVKV